MKKPYRAPVVRQITDEREISQVRAIKKIFPKTIGCADGRGRYAPFARVLNLEASPPGTHSGTPIRQDVWCVRAVTDVGVRYYGFAYARINSSLRMEVTLLQGQEHDEVIMKWEDAP